MSTTTHQGAEGAETMTAGLWRCPECHCHSYAHVDEQKPDGSFGPGPKIRCVNCKAVWMHRSTLATPAPRTDGGMSAGEDHFGYLFHNPDTGYEWSESHPIESGEVEDAENVRPATAKALHELLIEAWSDLEDARADLYTPAQPAGAVPDSLREAMRRVIAEWEESETGVLSVKTYRAVVDALDSISTHPAGQSAGSGAEDAGLKDAIAEIVRRAEKDQTFLRRTLARMRAEQAPAPDSTRTGQGEADISAAVEAAWRVFYASCGGSPFLPETHGRWEKAIRAALAARPAAPEAQGAWNFDVETAPRDGSDVEIVNDRGQFIAQFDATWTDGGWWMVSDGKDPERPLRGDAPFAWRIPTKAPAPPASSGQGGR